MFDIGMTELLVIGIVALIVVGPKDLPGMFRTLGRVTGKLRGMAREFQRAMEDAADEAGVKDVAQDLKSYANPKKYGLDKLSEAADSARTWEPMKAPAKQGPEVSALSEKRRAEAERHRQAAADRAEARRAGDAPASGAAEKPPVKAPAPAEDPNA